ncbi:hypothetical protein CS063_05530 [Sporanaerobium hydrogeniformans]|uniref:Uncharacterized protein n=1 Tax=Sporanaerobium hydrogeniformans TaxID=3072179 RepID=A0AC61DEP8_9FIRM|nr:stage II sporulation protein P [Sporanaerobium hydrogeniformans]PHV71508.1 hypothetical protein CS063_05530 [Sporanaerobium hydrogeniformans]
MRQKEETTYRMQHLKSGIGIKQLIFYSMLALLFLKSLTGEQGFQKQEVSWQLVSQAMPYGFKCANTGFFQQVFYEATHIYWKEPLTFVQSVLPSLRLKTYTNGLFTEDLPGYFPQDQELPYIEREGSDYAPQLPIVSQKDLKIENYKDPYYLLKNFVTGEAVLEIDADFLRQWDFYDLMTRDLRLDENLPGPKILIFHTHAREKFVGGTTVVDVGEALAKELKARYDIETLHITDSFYKDETENVTGCYEIMEPVIQKVLKAYPSIQMCIDLHRDGVDGDYKFVKQYNDKPTAQWMYFNGVCMNRNMAGDLVPMQDLQNPYLPENLSLSFQMQAIAYKYYPGLTRKIYFKPYRYSLHMKPLSTLIELGNQNNTGEEALNAVEPMANIIAKVLQKD